MELGGIERSLLGLLDAIDYDTYEVDLFLYSHHGELFKQINKNVNILPEVKELSHLRESFVSKVKNGCYYSALMRLLDEVKSKFIYVDHDRTWAKIMEKYAPKLEKQYDLALSFFLPFDFLKLKVNSKIKIGWIHTDYNGDKANRSALFKEYCELDFIAAVSDSCAESFNKIFPRLKSKVLVIENILSKKNIYNLSEEYKSDIFKNENINVLSIGRFSEAKNFDNVPEICKKLIEKGLKIKWYLIGYGGDEELIKNRIAENNMENNVIILGKKENPYPYIRQCDAYIQPSRYEGKSVAVREAQILCKPVIITAYATSRSQLKDGYDGVIVPMDNDGCASGIYRVLTDKKLMEELSYNCSQSDYTNSQEVEKLYFLMD